MSQVYSGWSLGVFDFDNDGLKDIFTANSHANDRVEAYEATGYKQHNSVFLNAGSGIFRDLSESGGVSAAAAHRGCAFADFDNDGRVDVVVSALGEPAELWRNSRPAENTWIIFA